MGVLLKNTITKRILIVFVTIIMLSNFIMPNYVCAKSPGEKLVSGIFYLVAYVGDVGIKLMQKMMIGTSEIKNGDEYDIKYSPGLIFSNSIIALDVNFINPNEDKVIRSGNKLNWEKVGDTAISISALREYYGAELLNKIGMAVEEDTGYIQIINNMTENSEQTINVGNKTIKIKFIRNEETRSVAGEMLTFYKYYGEVYDENNVLTYSTQKFTTFDYLKGDIKKYINNTYNNVADNDFLHQIKVGEDNYITKNKYAICILDDGTTNNHRYYYSVASIDEADAGTITSPAKELQKYISKWYIALRTIALVGLLSVLLYIGIRIILSSSSANDKAKYKNMLKDWVVAICILFVLHYMMAFMLEMTASLNHIINNNVVESSSSETPEGSTGEYKTDKLMNAVRKGVGDSYDDASALNTASYTIMYLALVILTGIFTVQYLKRVIYMAFLTMIAPMIALTYPLDKIKDNKAQAFSFWVREYIFNCLIQPVHLLLYTLLVGNVMDFAKDNMLYAVVALGFLVPAEKLIKEMFGMKSATPVGTLGAAAGGAVVMSMLNKMKAKPPKEDGKDGGGSGSPKGVRTATRSANGGGANPSEGNEPEADAGIRAGNVGTTGAGSTGTGATAPVMASRSGGGGATGASSENRYTRRIRSRIKSSRQEIYIWSRQLKNIWQKVSKSRRRSCSWISSRNCGIGSRSCRWRFINRSKWCSRKNSRSISIRI